MHIRRAPARCALRKRDASIVAAFEKTLEYIARPGVKAALTRKKNAEAKKNGG